MKKLYFVNKEYCGSMEQELSKILTWIFKIDVKVISANDRLVLLKIVDMMINAGEKVLENVTLDDIMFGTGLNYEEVEEAVWRLVEHGFFREIISEKGLYTDELYLVYSQLHCKKIEDKKIA